MISTADLIAASVEAPHVGKASSCDGQVTVFSRGELIARATRGPEKLSRRVDSRWNVVDAEPRDFLLRTSTGNFGRLAVRIATRDQKQLCVRNSTRQHDLK